MPPDVLDEIRATPGLLGKVLSFYVVPALGAQADYVTDAKGAEARQNLAQARRVNIVLTRS